MGGLPGFGFDRGIITIKFEQARNYHEAINRDYILNENEIGNYFRKFKISDSIDKTKISAKYDNGQLIVNLPKSET